MAGANSDIVEKNRFAPVKESQLCKSKERIVI